MSSDSDDLDEDELLQIALREQAERDLSYQRPSKKPVVNLVQRPPPPPSSSTNQRRPHPPSNLGPGKQQHQQQQRKPPQGRVEDDDDSEVELLSISSGDEDVPRERGGVQKGRGGDPKRRGGRADVGDQGWDGEEPNCWKYVDEAELARRVREMRDTRATPVVPALDRKASALGRKGLTNMQSMPRGVEALDPLGLGIIDSRSLMLITEASESSPTVAGSKTSKEPLDQKTREKLGYYSENFEAKLFLSRVHKDTSAADLEAGTLSLKTDLKGRTQQKKQLVKENFDCFVSCKTTIDDIESKLRQIEEDPEGAGTAQLYDATQKINVLANSAYQPLFERQVQAEKIRSVQGMLQRFRTLFNLPSAIRGSISKGEYDLAVREYRKAKSIVLPSHVGILKRVLEEVEKVMHEFKGMLHRSMEDPQLEHADLENTVRLLLELEPDSDPIWHYLNIQNRRIRGLLEKCTVDHDARMEILHNEIRERELSDARWRQLQQDSNKSLDIDSSNPEDSQFPLDSPAVDSTAEDALRERYIRRLTAVLLHHLPTFWRLALSVFSGKFAKVSAGNLLLDPEPNAKTYANKTDEKVMKYSSHSLKEAAEMVHSIISVYEDKVLNTFRDFEESNVLCPFMIDVIKEIAKACQAIEGKESAPSSAVTALYNLHFEIANIYIVRLCSWMRTTIKELSETWIPLSILERNRSPYTISFLPLEFRTVSVSAMDQINMLIQRLRSEATNSNGMFVQIQDIQDSVRLAFLNTFLDFAGYLENIGSELSHNRSNWEYSLLQQGNLSESGGGSAFHSGCAVTDPHKRILIVLSNIGYCKDELCDELYRKYMHIWLQPGGKDEQSADIRDLVMSFSALEEKVLEQYTFAKAKNIRTAALSYLFDAGIQWGGVPAVKGIRDATIELMNTLVSVHAEVSSGAKPLLDKTLGTLMEGLMDTFISLFHEHSGKHLKSLDSNGFCQLMLELDYLETVLGAYFSSEASESFKSLQDLLLNKASESVIESSETPGHNRRSTRGSEDAMIDDRQQAGTVSPDDLIALAQQFKEELLEEEIGRTRLNISCFLEPSLRPTPVKEVSKPAYSYTFSKQSANSLSYRTAQPVGSFSQQRRR